jgi:hypothetical protein
MFFIFIYFCLCINALIADLFDQPVPLFDFFNFLNKGFLRIYISFADGSDFEYCGFVSNKSCRTLEFAMIETVYLLFFFIIFFLCCSCI